MLRREGLYHSHIKEWARARDAGATAGLGGERSPGRRPHRAGKPSETEQLRAANQRLSAQLAQPGRRWTSWEKHTCSWRCSPRVRTPRPGRGGHDRGVHRAARGRGPHGAACALTGRARSSHYRRLRPPRAPRQGTPQAQRKPPTQALSTAERAAVLAVLNTAGYADLSIGQVWARELDCGRYWCSLSSMYRIARAAGQTRERRALATHPAKVKPELLADGPSQVWSWDITKLRGPAKGVWFHPYVLIDIYTRYTPGWVVARAEDSLLAKDFLDEAITVNGTAPHTVHADRGTSMTSKPVSALLVDLGVTRTHSRPRVSNDNPFSEAQFKTLKYLQDFPGSFATVHAAREYCAEFFAEYNHEHRHSGIAWHTPASVH